MLEPRSVLQFRVTEFAPSDIERRLAFVRLGTDDRARIAAVRPAVLEHLDEHVSAFFDHLSMFGEAHGLTGRNALFEDARRLKRDHLVAMVSGDYGGDYIDQRFRLGQFYSRAALEVSMFMGAFHSLMVSIGLRIAERFPEDPAAAFAHFTSLKKIAFFDIAVIVDAMMADREQTIRQQEEAIRELSTATLQVKVVEAAPNAMVMIGPTGLIEMVNLQAEAVFGYTRAEMLGQPIENLVPERFRRGHPKLRTAFFRDPQSRPMGAGRDLYGLKKDGSEFPIEIGLNPIETDDGVKVLSAIVDITSRKQLEDRFRRVVESAPNAMVMIAATGNIVMVNTQAEKVFGYDRRELLDQSIEMLVPERFRGHHPSLRADFFAHPEARPMGVGRDLFGLKKDGSEFPIEIGLNPIETEDGPMVLSAIVDISSRKRLEERFRRVVEAAPSAMVMIGPQGRIEMVNAQAERVFGYERAEMLGRSIELLVPERFRSHHPALRSSFFADPHSRPMGAGRDLYGLRKDGSEFPVEIGLNPIETEEGEMVLSAIVDISDRKQKEERIHAALKEKDTLLGEIHHRVKNNLQVVHSLLDLQSDLITDEKILGILRESQNRIRSMALIHQTLYESKDFVEVDFSVFLETLAPTLISSYGVDTEKVMLLIETVAVLLPINAAVPCGLVVNELISNALKHAFPDGRQGEIRIGLAPEPDGRAMLSVSDDGVGIAESYDLNQTTTLGLQLVALLTDQLGGDLEIHRANPTRFVLRFPIA